jgi:uncharacterized membrane protein
MASETDVRPETAAPQAAGPRRSRRHLLGVGCLTVAAALVYAACSFQQYWMSLSGSYDLVIFDQAVRSYSHFHLPVAMVKGIHSSFGPGFSVLGDHFSPILALLAPLYWIYDGPQTLLVAQALLFASATIPLWVFARRELGTVAAYCVSIGYALCWPVAAAVAFDFHEAAFAPVLFAVLFERLSAYQRDRAPWWHLALPAVALLCVKEDMGLMLAGFGAAMLVHSKGYRRKDAAALSAAFVVGGLAITVIATRVLIPAFGGHPDYYWRYGRFGRNVTEAAGYIARHPLDALRTFVRPSVKVQTMLWLLAIAAGAPLLSPYVLVVIPPLAERMLADQQTWWVRDYHYNAFLVVPLLCAFVDGVARLRKWIGPRARHAGLVWGALLVVIAVALFPASALRHTFELHSWRRGPDVYVAQHAADTVPSGVVVEAAGNIGPQLSSRTTVLLWDRKPRWAPWVVADVQRGQFPFCTLADQQRRVALLESNGYQVVFDERGYVVLHHPGPLPALDYSPVVGCG